MDGSTSTHPLSVLIACKIQGLNYEWRIPPGAERRVFPAGNSILAEQIHHHGTHEAYVNLISGKADLILVAREPSPTEITFARDQNVTLDLQPIALDALVFLVHARNPVPGLTLAQIRRIYGPDAEKEWQALGGNNATIEALQREENSGSQELIRKLVMQGEAIRNPPEISVVYTMAGPVHAVAMRENALGFSIFYYVTNMAPNPNVRMLQIEGMAPTLQSIANRTYPLVSEVYAVIRKNTKTSSPALLLRDWLLSSQGQDAVRESGYIPLPRKQGGK